MKDAPAFDFYPERWSHGTKHMTKVERCDYLDLLSQQWTNDGLPADLDILARILGYKKAAQIPAFVIEKFPVSDDGKRRNPRLEIERGKQRQRIEKRRDGAQKTNAKRWNSDSLSDRSATPQRPIVEGYSDSPPPTTHHSPIVLLEKEPKTPQEELPGNVRLDSSLPQELHDGWKEWQEYRKRRSTAKGRDKLAWTLQAARLGAMQVAAYSKSHGPQIVADRIASAIGGNWQGLNLDKITERASGFARPEDKVSHTGREAGFDF